MILCAFSYFVYVASHVVRSGAGCHTRQETRLRMIILNTIDFIC